MEYIRPLSSLYKDYVVRSLRQELVSFQQLVESLENSDQYEAGYLQDSLKTIEVHLRSLSRSLSSYN